MRNSPQKVGVSFLHDFPVSTLALSRASERQKNEQEKAERMANERVNIAVGSSSKH